MSSPYIFTMYKLSRTHPPDKQVLKDISLSFMPGAKIGVLGLNGSGKSTLLRIMAGQDTEYRGEAQLPDLPLPARENVRALITNGSHGAPRGLIECFPRLELIASLGIGVDAIDFACVRERGIFADCGMRSGPTAISDPLLEGLAPAETTAAASSIAAMTSAAFA
jgi:energy-coupling factor transporter ATP-binding protein EcfA2